MILTRTKCCAANRSIEHNERQAESNVAACVSQADERRNTNRNIRIVGVLIRTICLTFCIAPTIARAGEPDRPLPQWSSIPLQPFVRQLPKGGQLLFAESGDAANALYFVYVNDQLHAFSPANDKPLWTKPANCRLLPRILTLSKKRAVLANRYEIFALNILDGSRAWTFGDYPENLGDVRFDHENAPSFRYFTMSTDRIFAVRDNGELSVVDIQTGNAIATQPLPHHPINQPVACGDRLVFAARTNKGERLCIVQCTADKIEHVTDLNLGAGVSSLVVANDNTVIAASIAGVSAIDPIECRVRWRWRTSRPIVANSLRVAGNGIYLATQDKIIVKLWLESGAQAWRSQPLAMQCDGTTRLEIINNRVIAIGDGFANILESTTGTISTTLWSDEQVTADHCAITSQYMILLTQDGAGAEQSQSIRIHDHKDDAEVEAPKSMLSIKALAESPTITTMDDALIIQDGERIYGWRMPPNPHRRLKSRR